MSGKSKQRATHKYQGGIEVIIVLLDVVRIVLNRPSLVHGVEVELRIIGLDGLEERPESILKAAFGLQSAARATWSFIRTTLDQFSVAGTLVRSFRPFRRRP